MTRTGRNGLPATAVRSALQDLLGCLALALLDEPDRRAEELNRWRAATQGVADDAVPPALQTPWRFARAYASTGDVGEAERQAGLPYARFLERFSDVVPSFEVLDHAIAVVRAHMGGGAWTLPEAVSAATLVARPAPDLDWVLRPALPAGEVGLLVGSDGSGKSYLALQAGIAVATGTPWAGGLLPAPEKTGPVVYLAGEDDLPELHRRLCAIVTASRGPASEALTRLDNLHIVSLDSQPIPLLVPPERGTGEPVETPWVHAVGRLLAEKQARLAIFDPLITYHAVSESDNLALDRLVRLIRRLVRGAGPQGCAALIVHHAGQAAIRGDADDHLLGRGGTGLNAAARAVFTVRRVTREETELLEQAGEDPHAWRAVRGPKISRAPELPAAYVQINSAGVPSYVPQPLWVLHSATKRVVALPRRSRTAPRGVPL